MSVVCRLPLLPAGPEMTVASTCAALRRRVHYITLYCAVNHNALHYNTLHYITLHCTPLHYIVLWIIVHYIALCCESYCITLHCAALHCIVLWIIVHYSLSYHSAQGEESITLHCTVEYILKSVSAECTCDDKPLSSSCYHYHYNALYHSALYRVMMISILHYISTSWNHHAHYGALYHCALYRVMISILHYTLTSVSYTHLTLPTKA